METNDTATKRSRTPGVHYPGASLATVLELLKVLDAAGGSSSIGRVAAKLDMAEGAASFKRVLISARNYGLAEWANTDKSVIEMTEAGRQAVGGDVRVLQRALIVPPTFRAVARKFNGRALPVDGLAEAFKVVGVAPSGAQLAADNFEASAGVAAALSDEGGRKILAHDLPFEEFDATADSEGEAARKAPGAGLSRDATTAKSANASDVGRNARADSARQKPANRTPILKLADERRAPSLNMELRFDLAGWSVDQVVELVRRLRAEGFG